MAQPIPEITSIPSNSNVLKILNQIIKRYNSLGSIYTFKGNVQTYDDLLAIQNPNVGDVYNVIEEDAEHQVAAGSNFVWDGTIWDNLGGSLAGLVQSVNGINPDSLGNVLLPLIKNVTANGGNIVFTKNDDTNVKVNNVKKLYVVGLGANVDLNDLIESGVYMCGNNSYAANYENCPVQKSFLIEVQQSNDGYMVYQFLTQYNDGSSEAGNQYVRTYQATNGWSAWRIAGNGSNLTTYTSLEQIGITPGQESFASIHNALPINSVLEYYAHINSNFNDDMYPVTSYYGVLQAVKLDNTKTIFSFYAHNVISNNEFSILYLSAYDRSFSDSRAPVWKKVAFDSDLPVIASEAEAKAGTNNAKFMTPLRTKQAITAQVQGIPIGDVVYRPFLMDGYVKANGATVNRSDYPTLVQYANDHSLWTDSPASEPWKYGNGNGSTTMTLPNYRNRVIQGGDSTAIVAAGLPNIKGGTNAATHPGGTYASWLSGAFYNTTQTDSSKQVGGTYNLSDRILMFDASRSNSIYGKSSTVQPPALRLIPQIKY